VPLVFSARPEPGDDSVLAQLPAPALSWLAALAESPSASRTTLDFLRQELAKCDMHALERRLAMHRALDGVHNSVTSFALQEASQIVDQLRASLRAPTGESAAHDQVCGQGGTDCGLDRDLAPLPESMRVKLTSLQSSPSVSEGMYQLIRSQLLQVPGKAWSKKKATRIAFDAVYQALASHALAELAQLLGALRAALECPGSAAAGPDCALQRRQRKYLVREAAVGLAWDKDAKDMSGRVGECEDDACEFVEPGVDYPVNALEMHRHVSSWRKCCALCRRDPGCVFWTWASPAWQVESTQLLLLNKRN
jgi:hypothetical protein